MSDNIGAKTLGGIYGTAIATMGMLAVAGMILGMDGFGPIVDNAAGIADVNVSGVTGIMLREGHDIQDQPVINSQWAYGGTGYNFYNGAYFRSSEYSEDNTSSPDVGPRLTITYSSSSIKKINGIAQGSVKKISGITAANIKKLNGVDF